MRKLLTVIVLFGLVILGLGIHVSYAGEIDILLEKLVDKGVLTGAEAQQIKIETKEAMKKEAAKGKSETLPQWLQTMKMKGDFRLRYQYNHNKTVNSQTSERHRGRLRLRLGVESKVNDKLSVGLGLATGSSSASSVTADTIRSTNQSFDDTFSKKPLNLDYAFAKYTPNSWITLIGGKMKLKDVLWEPKDLLWDTDITPEGAALVLTKKLSGAKNTLFLNTNYFVLEEDGSSGDDPWVFHIQPGINHTIRDDISFKGALSYYYWAVGNTTLHGSAGTNSWGATPKKDVVNLIPAFEIKMKEPLKGLGLDFPTAKIFGEYVVNTNDSEPDNKKSGYLMGLAFGADKISGWGDWQIKYNFARLGRDAVLDEFPDSDRYSGKTDMRSHELEIAYGLSKNTYLCLDIYRTQKLTGTRAPETLVQVDWNMKF